MSLGFRAAAADRRAKGDQITSALGFAEETVGERSWLYRMEFNAVSAEFVHLPLDDILARSAEFIDGGHTLGERECLLERQVAVLIAGTCGERPLWPLMIIALKY